MAFFTAVLLVSLGSTSAGGKDPLSPGRVHFVIKAGQRTIVDLELAEQETYRWRFQTSDRVASSRYS
jgi:hypothetical protein